MVKSMIKNLFGGGWMLSKTTVLNFIAVLLPLCVFAAEPNELTVKAVLFPFRQAVISAEVDSSVKGYFFEEGEIFKQGDVIAKLDDRAYMQKLERAKAAKLEAESGVQFSDKSYQRNMDMYKKGIQGMQELEKSELDKDVSVSKLNFAVANMKMAELDLNACKLTAPFGGRLVKKQVQEHEFIRVGQPIFSVIDDNQLLAVMHLPSEDITTVKLGMKMKIVVDETKTEHEGTIHTISGEIEPGSRTFEIKVLLNNKNHQLTAGMSGKLLRKK